MEMRQLRHFVAVADTLHFGRAAEVLGMTQPPLSQSILALERELGAALFARTKRSVALTPFGSAWLTHVRTALSGVGALPEIAARLLAGQAGRLELSFVSIADFSLLPDLVRVYRNRFPSVEMKLIEATSDIQVAALLNGQGDAGIIIAPHAGVPDGLAYRRLLSEPLMAAVPECWVRDGSLVVEDGCLVPASVARAPVIVFPRHVAPAFHALVMDYYRACGAQARIVQEAIQMQTIISLVSAGMGIAIVPASLRNLVRPGTCYLGLRNAPDLDIGIAWRKGAVSPPLQNLLDVANQACPA